MKSRVVALSTKRKKIMYNVNINVLVNGHKVKQYSHNNNLYIQANEGSEYEIEIKNDYPNRILAIVGVDGLSIINGEPLKDNSTGYIINAYSNIVLKGYRINNNEEAAFKFSKKKNSYAAGKYSNPQCGVISIKCYHEKSNYIFNFEKSEQKYGPTPSNPPTWNNPWTPWKPMGTPYKGTSAEPVMDYVSTTCSTNYSSPSCDNRLLSSSPSEEFSLGTAWGQKKISKVTNVDFERGVLIGEENIYYAPRHELINMGIEVHQSKNINLPKGFNNEYCKPPVGWNG